MNRWRRRTLLVFVAALAFDASALAWQRDVGTPVGPNFFAVVAGPIALDPLGNAIVGGSTYEDFYVAKFSRATGDVLWSRRYGQYNYHPGRVRGLQTDSSGNVLAAGDSGLSASSFLAVKLGAADGEEIWRYERNDMYAFATALDQDANGDVAVAGNFGDGSFAVVKLAAGSGLPLWTYDVVAPLDLSDVLTARDVAFDGNGDVVACGFGDANLAVVKLDGVTGAEIWRYTHASPLRYLVVDAAGDVYAGASGFTVKLSGVDGAETWRHEYASVLPPLSSEGTPAVELQGALILAGADVIAAGSTADMGLGAGVRIVRLAGGTGGEIWRKDLAHEENSVDAPTSLALHSGGDVIAGGWVNRANDRDFVITRVAGTDGSQLWQQVGSGRGGGPSGDAYRSHYLANLTLDTAGNVFGALLVSNQIAALRLADDGSDSLAGTRLRLTESGGSLRLRLLSRRSIGIWGRAGLEGDPTLFGATLEVRNPSTGEMLSVPLPAAGWSEVGTIGRINGFRYDGAAPCERVRITAQRTLKISCNGLTPFLDEASQGSLAVRLTTGSGSDGHRYCAVFGGTVTRDEPGKFIAKNAPAPDACPFL